jgi:hypothetical protein
LRFAAPTPGLMLQRFEIVDKLPIRKRAEGSGLMSANKASAIGDQAVHRLPDARMKVSAGINTIVLGKTGNVADLSCIRRHNVAADYTPNQGAI